MKELLEQHVQHIKERHERCRGNEQATKNSLIRPLFEILGYNMADPWECEPEYRADFGSGQKAATPVDWAFRINNNFAFFVEAKEAGVKLKKYAEQLGMYFAKEPLVKLGIYTNGVDWQFYTDLDHEHVMDRTPFLTWKPLEEDIPLDFLTILQRSRFTPQFVRTFAEKKRHKSLLIDELNRLLSPSPEFIQLAVRNIETGKKLTQKRIEDWKPILESAIHEWAKQYTLTMALQPAEARPDREKTVRKKGKRCPSCKTVVGPRTRQCGCGHVFVPKKAREVDEGTPGDVSPEPRKRTDRAYWEARASRKSLAATDGFLGLVRQVEPDASLKYTKHYIGLAVDGSPRNFVSFRPAKKHVIIRLKLPQQGEVDHQLEEARIATLPYSSQWNHYRVKTDGSLDEKQRDVLLRLIRQAKEGFGRG